MIDIHKETLLSTGECRKLPGKPDPGAILKWIRKGCKSLATGRLVKLEKVQIGSRLYTSVEAFERFMQRLNEEHDVSSSSRDEEH